MRFELRRGGEVTFNPSGDDVLFYLAAGIVLLLLAVASAKLPFRELPANPLRWHLWVVSRAFQKNAGNFPITGLLSGLSFCAFASAAIHALALVVG